ncbi:hypothetical protein M0805_008361 [Coniferiporia weirii]|nr:hypothetical protein M0805_008361 [Coniferiporia weirii]
MSVTHQKPRKQQAKPKKLHLPATSAIAQPVVEDAVSSTILSAFSPDALLFAFLSLAVDKHRLRVYDVNANRVVAEHIVDRARVTSLAWIPFGITDKNLPEEKENPPSKKRKKPDSGPGRSEAVESTSMKVQAVALGLSDGSVQLFSAAHGRVLRTLAHPSSKSSVLAITKGSWHGDSQSVWTSGSDGVLHLWDLRNGGIIFSSQDNERAHYSALAIRPGVEDNQAQILAANNTIYLLSSSSGFPTSDDDDDGDSLKSICSFGGHASPVKHLIWDSSASSPKRFYSSAEGDRFVYIWEIFDLISEKGKMVASCPLDTDVRQMNIFASSGRQILLALSSSGKVTLSPVPAELSTSVGGKGSLKQHVPTLLPRTTINLSATKSTSDVRIVAATLEENHIRVALLSGGAKVVFESLEYLDSAGDFVPELQLQPKASVFGLEKRINGIATHRYTESTAVAVGTGAQTAYDPSLDALVDEEVEGALDADLAELSLGQRLAAVTEVAGENEATSNRRSGSDIEDGSWPNRREKRRRERAVAATVPAHSLTRTLIQALHAGDTSLLEACLTHSDEVLVRNTVARLPPQLAIPLLTACVERLGRGARGNGLKGRGGGASAQRGMALVKWVRAVLTIHGGYLMTMPDLVARLSHLYSTLTTRLTLQERLLTLSGRLDLVLAQVELRSSNTPAPLLFRSKKTIKCGKPKSEPLKYVEGESSDEEGEQTQAEVEGGEDSDEEGSVEDVELGGDSNGESEDDEDENEDESETDDDGGDGDDDGDDNLANGFIDDEAEDGYDEDESEEDSN